VASIVVKKRSGDIKEFDINNLALSMRNVGVDDKSAEHIADEVKSKIGKSDVPIATEKIEEIVVDELEKKDWKTAKKFKKHYKERN
jgi:2-phosphoglycerate kinase